MNKFRRTQRIGGRRLRRGGRRTRVGGRRIRGGKRTRVGGAKGVEKSVEKSVELVPLRSTETSPLLSSAPLGKTEKAAAEKEVYNAVRALKRAKKGAPSVFSGQRDRVVLPTTQWGAIHPDIESYLENDIKSKLKIYDKTIDMETEAGKKALEKIYKKYNMLSPITDKVVATFRTSGIQPHHRILEEARKNYDLKVDTNTASDDGRNWLMRGAPN